MTDANTNRMKKPARLPVLPLRSQEGRICALLALVLAHFVAGCVSTYFVPVGPTSGARLYANEAFLVLQIDSDLPIRRLELSGLLIKQPIAAGEHFYLAKVRPGRQSWRSVTIERSIIGYAGQYDIVRSRFPRPNELDFDIEAGLINYAGELIIRRVEIHGARSWISIRVRNHAAKALQSLEKSYPDLLDAYPIRTAGMSGDAFIEFYMSERARIREASDSTVSEGTGR